MSQKRDSSLYLSYKVTFPKDVDTLRISVDDIGEGRATKGVLSVQNFSCPVYDLPTNVGCMDADMTCCDTSCVVPRL